MGIMPPLYQVVARGKTCLAARLRQVPCLVRISDAWPTVLMVLSELYNKALRNK